MPQNTQAVKLIQKRMPEGTKLVVTYSLSKTFRFRLYVAMFLIRIAAIVAGYGIEWNGIEEVDNA